MSGFIGLWIIVGIVVFILHWRTRHMDKNWLEFIAVAIVFEFFASILVLGFGGFVGYVAIQLNRKNI